MKEYAFLQALYRVDYPTPEPIAHNRHVVCMSLVRGVPLYQVRAHQLSTSQAQSIYQQAMAMATRLAQQHGLVHCDLNEFNLLVDLSGVQALATTSEDPYVRDSGLSSVHTSQSTVVSKLSQPAWKQSLEAQDDIVSSLPEPVARLPDTGEPQPVVVLIDFPQMISTHHHNARDYYQRDVQSLRRFFAMRLKMELSDAENDDDDIAADDWSALVGATATDSRLDTGLKASGVSAHEQQQLELYYFDTGPKPIASAVTEQDEEEEDDDADEEAASEEDSTAAPVNTIQIERDHQEATATGNDDTASLAAQSMMSSLSIRTMSREELQVVAKERVRRQMDEQKRKAKRKGAFSKRNSNKTYEKGKRIVADSLF